VRIADAPTLPTSTPRKRPKSWWWVRVLVAAATVLSIGYATLPFWLPPEWLARQLMNQLSTALNRRVQIDRVHLGWIEGIVFEGVTIEDRPDSTVPILAKFGRIRCEFKPILTAVKGRVQELQIDEPSLFLAVDQNGRLNIDDLASQEFRGLPSQNFLVRRLTCHVHTPRGLDTVGFESLECHLDHDTGILRLLGQVWTGKEDRGRARATPEVNLAAREATASRRLSIHAHVTVPRLKRGENLAGEVQIEWDQLSLRDLPLGLVPKLPFEQVKGTSAGRMTIHTQPDLGIDFGLKVTLHGVRLQRGDRGRWPQLPDAEVLGEGHWDPTTDVLVLKSLGYETPAIKLVGPAGPGSPAARIDSQGEVSLELHTTGTVKDWSILYQEWPQLEDRVREAGLVLSGGTDFGLNVTRRRDEDHVLVTIDGARTACSITSGERPILAVIADMPKTARIDLLAGRSLPQRVQPRFEGTLGSLSISGWADWVSPVAWSDLTAGNLGEVAEQILPSAQGEIEIFSRQMEEILSLLPPSSVTEKLRDCRGPVQLGLSYKPEANDRRIELDLITQVDTRIKYRDLFDKPEGQSLRASARLDFAPTAVGRVKDLRVQVDCGRSRIVAGPDDVRLEYELGLPKQDPLESGKERWLKASWSLAAQASHVEDLLTLWPQWRRWCEAGPDREVAGTAGMRLHGELALFGPNRSLRTGADLVADRMQLRWDNAVTKATGVPLSVSVSHQVRLAKQAGDQSLEVTLRGTGGTVSGSWSSDRVNADGGFLPLRPGEGATQRTRFKADITDVAGWLDLVPSLSQAVGAWDPSGCLTIGAEAELTGARSRGSFSLEASEAGFHIPGSPDARKPAGSPLNVAFAWSHGPSPENGNEGIVKITGGNARIAGLELARASAVFGVRERVVESKDATSDSGRNAGTIPFHLRLVDFQASGRIAFDDSLRSMHPRLQEWFNRAQVTGTAEWRGEAHACPDGLALTGSLDTRASAFSLATGHESFPQVKKATGTPLSLSWDAVLGPEREEDERSLLVRDLLLRLDGNEASVAGTLGFSLGHASRPDNVEADLTSHIRVQKSRSLAAMLPESWINDLEGKAEAWLGLLKDQRGLRLGRSRLEFDELVVGTRDQPIELNGAVAIEQDGLSFDQLRCEWGASRGVISGSLRQQGDTQVGTIGVAMEHLDIGDLHRRLRAVSGNPATGTPGSPGSSRAIVRAVIERLRSAEVTVDAHIDVLEAVLPPKQPIIADAVAARSLIRKGPVEVSFQGLADGGVITGEIVSATQSSDPVYHLKYTAEDIHPGPLVDGYLRLSFPGMKATGPLTLIDETYQKLLPEVGDPNYEVGQGELIIKGGSVIGRAAPRWMARYLPGLNLARFDFSYMHSWFKKTPTGRIHHQMIFRGPIYNLYMIGHSDPDRQFEYEVGVDFLADFDSKYWAESGQGRVPLFVKSGLVAEDGALLDERVNFVSIERLAESLFVRNNLVVTAYHAVRKRVLGQR